ncbi:MAG: outer membrane lipoprotein carrier protein LolA [Proteobacteria bacterium]|nr:outer membrane lipoprotein carrier protein LolA [Pseudomonadota bacterium]
MRSPRHLVPRDDNFLLRFRHKFIRCFIIASILCIASTTAWAKDYTLYDVEDYLSSLKSFSAKFDQFVPGESFSRGEVFIKKPGKFLWQYTTPERVKIVSNGGFVYFIDEKEGQTTQLPTSGVFFSILSKKNFTFSKKGITVDKFFQNEDRVDITIITDIEGTKIPLGMTFKKLKNNKLSLIKIASLNQLDQSVIISLYEHNETAKINNKIFKVDVEEDEIR